ncbi:hypothetical protein CL619_00050 [archaeon]|nr:hypothetical protein [archaeon]
MINRAFFVCFQFLFLILFENFLGSFQNVYNDCFVKCLFSFSFSKFVIAIIVCKTRVFVVTIRKL